METGVFAALSDAAHQVVLLFGRGLGPAEVRAELLACHGEEIELEELSAFVEGLAELGFVASVDGHPLPTPLPRPTFPWLTPARARWTLSPFLPWTLLALLAAATGTLLVRPGLTPGYRDLLVSSSSSVNLVAMFAAGWTILLLHETAHLLVARATGVPARMSLGTRLQFLVAQTDISGIELAARRHRMTAYLAGLAVNLTVVCLAVLARAAVPAGSAAADVLGVAATMAVLPIPFELMVFMRTDVYFVLQDLSGCRDLHGQGRAYARYRARRATAFARRSVPGPDPSADLPEHERRAVRWYTVVLVAGSAACLAAFAGITLPADLTMLVRAARRAAAGNSPARRADGAVVLLVLGGAQLLWLRTKLADRRKRRSPERG
jgi:hypothetical protein